MLVVRSRSDGPRFDFVFWPDLQKLERGLSDFDLMR